MLVISTVVDKRKGCPILMSSLVILPCSLEEARLSRGVSLEFLFGVGREVGLFLVTVDKVCLNRDLDLLQLQQRRMVRRTVHVGMNIDGPVFNRVAIDLLCLNSSNFSL